MRRAAAALLPLLATTPALAAERAWSIGSVERVRVEAPVEVRVVTGGGNGVSARGDDRAALAALDVAASAGTLVIRRPGGRRAARDATPIVVTVRTPRLEGVAVYATAPVTVGGIRGTRVALSVTEGGTLAATGIQGDAVVATLAGEGTMTLAGRGGEVRLIANGTGTLDAAALTADRLDVQALDKVAVTAAARDTARVVAVGDVAVTVAGRAPCTVRKTSAATVTCGAIR